MNEHKIDILKLLNDYVDPSELDYQEWVDCGMALKAEGYTASDWDAWSKPDSRYRPGECFKKWNSFEGSGITGATITQMAKDRGWTPRVAREERALSWDDEISGDDDDDYVVIDKNWIEGQEIKEPSDWNPVREIVRYLETLFESTENVGYVTETYAIKDDKTGEVVYKPTKGNVDRTAGQLIQALNECKGDIGAVIGDVNPEAGAWIRCNPLDGKGVKNDNVTDYRYALVESDTMDIEKQNAIMRELELPIAIMVYSGGKSIHAIVKVEASDYTEYRKRVDYLYNVCQKNGLNPDKQDRNPSRLSRMPGVVRNGKKQFIIDTNIGKSSWEEWYEWIEAVNDDLPDPESLTDYWNNMPELAPPLIDGVLRQGHKMLMAGPSKAGKSFALIELVIAIAEGTKWMTWPCTRGRVLYVNLELDRASCLHRFKHVYEQLNLPPDHIDNIDIWNLRGKSVPMDKLAPKLIRRSQKKDYIAVIIDPIYKVLTGDENSADQMAHFTNQFDKIATELGCSVIYCHHHSKGLQGGKRSMDRASGSGVFARDPDALLDLTELPISDDLRKQQENKALCAAYERLFRRYNQKYLDNEIGPDDRLSSHMMKINAEHGLKGHEGEIKQAIHAAEQSVRVRTAWRIDGTLREFPKFAPVDIWFDYPIHRVDEDGVLKDVQPEIEQPSWKKAASRRKPKEQKQKERNEALDTAFDALNDGEHPVTVSDLSEYMGISERSVWRRIKDHGGFKTEKGKDKQSIVTKKQV